MTAGSTDNVKCLHADTKIRMSHPHPPAHVRAQARRKVIPVPASPSRSRYVSHLLCRSESCRPCTPQWCSRWSCEKPRPCKPSCTAETLDNCTTGTPNPLALCTNELNTLDLAVLKRTLLKLIGIRLPHSGQLRDRQWPELRIIVMGMGFHVLHECLFHTLKDKISSIRGIECLLCKPYQVPKGCGIRAGWRKCPFPIKLSACARTIIKRAPRSLAKSLS